MSSLFAIFHLAGKGLAGENACPTEGTCDADRVVGGGFFGGSDAAGTGDPAGYRAADSGTYCGAGGDGDIRGAQGQDEAVAGLEWLADGQAEAYPTGRLA